MSITGRPAQIADALMTHALLMQTQGPTLPVSVPEPAVTFVPPTDNDGNALPYLEVTGLPNRDKWEGLHSGRIRQGLFQITVIWPKHQGDIRPLQVAGQVEAHFAKNTILISGDARVRLAKEPWTADALRGDIDSRFPVTVDWTCGG